MFPSFSIFFSCLELMHVFQRDMKGFVFSCTVIIPFSGVADIRI